MKMQTTRLTAADIRFGFQLPPDISIDLIRFKPTSDPSKYTATRHPLNRQYQENDDREEDEYDEGEYDEGEYDEGEDEYEYDPDFHPLVFCTTTMDDDEKKDEITFSQIPTTTTVSSSKSKKGVRSTTTTTQSNENSSLVCNAAISVSQIAMSKPRKRFTCHICQKTFGWTTDLKRHILIHTGERPFKCDYCVATFTRNFLLQKHVTKVHQCQSPTEVSQLNNNVAKNVMAIKEQMKALEEAKVSNGTDGA